MRPAAFLLALALTACGGGGAAPSPGTDAAVDGSWQLTSGRTAAGGIPILADRPITLTVEGSSIGGTAACNSYGGRLAGSAGRIRVEELGMTAMGCEADVMASEAAYTSALSSISQIGRDGAELVLLGQDVELRFVALPAPPTAELVDTSWTLETVFVGDVAAAAAGEPARLTLRSDGTFTGSTGCRSFTGTWVEDGERIRDTSMRMDGAECAAGLAHQDATIVSVVGDGFVPSIDGDLLTLTDPGGAGLVYRAGD
jgi:heat shock protein HslJ